MTKYPEWIEEKDGSLWLTEYERENLKISYRLKEIIFSESSPFQHVMIVDTFDFGRALVWTESCRPPRWTGISIMK